MVDSIKNNMVYLRNIIMLSVVVAIIASILLNSILVDRITKNIRIIIKKMDDVIHSDGDLTKQVEMHTGDELEIVAKMLNEFITNLHSIIVNLSDSTVMMQQHSEQLDDDVDKVHENVIGITGSMHELSAMLEETSISMAQINSATEHIANEADHINKDTQEGFTYSNEVKQRAEEMTDKAVTIQRETQDLIEGLQKQVEDKIVFAGRAKSISEITSQIIAISNRTNMLSLNASIEAARVGEQGKGFAVVAQDVAQLAKETKNAAEQILTVSDETE